MGLPECGELGNRLVLREVLGDRGTTTVPYSSGILGSFLSLRYLISPVRLIIEILPAIHMILYESNIYIAPWKCNEYNGYDYSHYIISVSKCISYLPAACETTR